MSIKKTHEEFEEQFYKKYDCNEYELLSKYNSNKETVKVSHKKCSYPTGLFEYETTPNTLLDKRRIHLCPFCSNNFKWTEEKFKDYLSYVAPTIEPLDNFKSGCELMNFKCKKCNGVFKRTPTAFKSKRTTCPYCCKTKKLILTGYNDMWTTRPDMAKYLKNPSDGYTVSFDTTKILEWECPNCHNTFNKAPSKWVFDSNGKFKCPHCMDGFSYPEKFVSYMLSQLNISYKPQLSCTTFEWCGNYRYDFYIPDFNMIIETHGVQHYEESFWDLDRNKSTDEKKYELAISNGIDHYIIIDCRYSEKDFIVNNILNSELVNFFNIESVDFDLCNLNAISSYMKPIWDDWNTGIYDINALSQKYNIGIQTIRTYLIKGKECNLCTYDPKENIKKTWSATVKQLAKPVYCIELKRLFISQQDVRKQLGFNLNKKAIDDIKRTSGGYHWRSATKQEKDEINPYLYLSKLCQ